MVPLRRYVSVLGMVLAGCAQATVPSATPADQLPPFMATPEIVAAARGEPGSTYAANDTTPSVSSPGKETPKHVGIAAAGNPEDLGLDNIRASDLSALTLVPASPQPTAFALIIGIESYRDVTPADGARSDAERFAEVARVTLGIPEDNIRLLVDERASRTDIAKQLRWLQSNVRAGSRVYFYFSGHGAPDPTSGTSFIVPYDGDPQYLSDTAIPMAQVLRDLEQTKAREILALTDSCFSGAGGRSVLAPGTRPLVRVHAPEPQKKVALFSASSGAQISGPAADGLGGVFSKYVFEALGTGAADMNGDGQVSLRELSDWVEPRVEREARRANREQTPQLMLGKKVGSSADFIISWGYAR